MSNNNEWDKIWNRIKNKADELGVDPLIFGLRIIDNLESARAIYPDDQEKALEMTGIALYEEFGRVRNG